MPTIFNLQKWPRNIRNKYYSYIMEAFRDIADQDYVGYRLCALGGAGAGPCEALSQQFAEKYLKAILAFHGVSTFDHRGKAIHELSILLERIDVHLPNLWRAMQLTKEEIAFVKGLHNEARYVAKEVFTTAEAHLKMADQVARKLRIACETPGADEVSGFKRGEANWARRKGTGWLWWKYNCCDKARAALERHNLQLGGTRLAPRFPRTIRLPKKRLLVQFRDLGSPYYEEAQKIVKVVF